MAATASAGYNLLQVEMTVSKAYGPERKE